MQGWDRQAAYPRGSGFYAGNDGMDDFEEQYDSEAYYDEEMLPSDESELLREHQAHQLMMKQQQAKMAQQYQGPGAKPLGANMIFGASNPSAGAGIGGPGSLGVMGMGGASIGAGSVGGGFTYGSASAAGMVFGAASAAGPIGSTQGMSFGASGASKGLNSNATNFSGKNNQFGAGASGFQFGGASQFGAIGSGSAGLFGAGAAPQSDSNDPYAKIDIDLTKVKKAEKPSKPFEQRTEEEKAKDVESKGDGTAKSNLKSKKEESITGKKEVRFGKSTTYQVEPPETTEETAFNKEGTHEKGGSPRPSKRIIQETDLSDARDEKEKIKEQLEQEEKEALEALRKMEAWKKAQAEKEREQESTIFSKQKMEQARQKASAEESVGSSSMSNAHKSKPHEESYSSDPFEEVSVSGSGDKENNIWTRNQASQPKRTDKVTSSSSDKYEDDFESMSKSKSESLMDSKKDSQRSALPKVTLKKTADTRSVLATYVKKENKGTMTDTGKYTYMSASETEPTSMKEWSLKRNLEDAEMLIQELKAKAADDKETIRGLEVKLKQKDLDYQQQRREAMGAQETVKRMTDQIKDFVHKQSLFAIESEQLIKQIDMADAKTREKEDELVLARAEYERKLKQMEERILYKREVDGDRKLVDLKHEHQVELEKAKMKHDELQEQLDYLNEKCNRLMTENKSVRTSKDSKNDIKRLEDENAVLKEQLQRLKPTTGAGTEENLIIEGLNRENEKAEAKIRDLTDKLKKKDKELEAEKKRAHELQLLQMKNKNIVFVETKEAEPDIQTANLMGPSNSISEKQLKDMHETIKSLRTENDDLKRDYAVKETALKNQVQKAREEKVAVEKQLFDTEFALGEKDTQLTQVKDGNMKERKLLEQQIVEMEDKIKWFRENQRILSDQQRELSTQNSELGQLRTKLKKAEESDKTIKELERKCRIYEETIKSKNPNSVAMLIQAAKDAQPRGEEEEQSRKQMAFRIKQLEGELDEKDKDFERRLRALRQEQERMKQVYEDRSANPAEAAKVNELEAELAKTKNYYLKRIRELEDKYKVRGKTTEVAEKSKQKKAEQTMRPSEISPVVEAQKDTKLLAQIESLQQEKSTLQRMLIEAQQALQAQPVNITTKNQPVAAEPKAAEVAQPKINPFFVEEEQSGPRTVQQIFHAIAIGKVNLRQFEGQTLRLSKVHQAFQGLVSLPELKQLQQFLAQSHEGDAAKTDVKDDDYIDMDELISAVLIGDKTKRDKEFEIRRTDDANETEDLKRKLKRILREKDDDCEFFNAKIRQLKRQLKDAQDEKAEAEENVHKLEAQKQRIEKFYRNKMGLDAPVDKTKTHELMTEVSVLQRRLEFLEEQADERNKAMVSEHAPCRREIQRLQQELVEEKDLRNNLINKKNKEISYFKNELDGLLADIASTSTDSV